MRLEDKIPRRLHSKIERTTTSKVFEEVFTEFHGLHRETDISHLKVIIVRALQQLRNLIDNPDELTVHWPSPYCVLNYYVQLQWSEEIEDLLEATLQNDSVATNGHHIDNLNVLQKIEDAAEKSQTIEILRKITENVVILQNSTKEIYCAVLPQEIQNYLEKEKISKKEETDVVKILSQYNFEFTLNNQETNKVSGIEFTSEDIFSCALRGLIVDVDEKIAYFPITVQLKLGALHGRDLFFLPERNQIEKEIWERVEKGIEGYFNAEEQIVIKSQRDFSLLRSYEETFAFPSNAMMFSLLALFAGRPEKISHKLLEKPYREQTFDERKQSDTLISSTFDIKDYSYYDDKGNYIIDKQYTIAVAENPKVKANATFGLDFMNHTEVDDQLSLAMYIRRTFGSEGLRHLLGFLIGLDDSGRTGKYEWSVNEHLERLGYKRAKNGSFPVELKNVANNIVRILTGLFITISNKNSSGTGRISGRRLFYIEGFDVEYKEHWPINEKLNIVASDFWYGSSFEKSETNGNQFTKLLREVATENHREHPLTIYLSPLLAVFWRMNHEVRELKVRSLMEWCDIPNDRRLRESLRKLEEELDYMVEKGYLGKWGNKSIGQSPSTCEKPLECVITFYPPEWLKEELKSIASNKDLYTEPQRNLKAANPILTKEELKEIIEKIGMSNRKFAELIGVSPSLITRYIRGERVITRDFSDKINQIIDKYYKSES